MTAEKNIFNVTDTNSRGYGIIKDNGKVIFVAESVEGDVCRIEKTDEKKNYSTARVTELITSSPYRINPDCPCFETCGGCSLRHVSYEQELKIKRNTVSSAFRRAGISVDVSETLRPSPDGYRNKVSFKVSGSRIGFFKKETNSFISLENETCKNAPGIITRIASEIAEFAFSQNIRIEEIVIRRSTGGMLSAQIIVEGSEKKYDSLNCFSDRFASLSVKNITTGKTHRIFGEGGIRTEAFGLSLFVSDESFFQVNYDGAELMFGVISSIFSDISFDLCADLFCGTGVWGLALAKRFPDKLFYGVDLNESAIGDATRNAEINGIENITFFCGDASMKTDLGSPDAVIVDPPRAGLSPGMIDTIISIKPDNLIYISCNPFTLARDAVKLTESGYSIKTVIPIDLFPRTEHVETVCLLCKQ
ncbi:MAG: 23S rRNA (uracil(1939)-C(5))-methyltransferase RlmD [Clostridia bacterium]|nr:23S rRNA (uracil(1939)-C(5))-methyltransferase RlmD [Clostridia bacterium]